MTEKRSSNLNVPNVLTVLRIIMVPLFVAVLFWQPANQGWRFTASGIFVAAMLTDLADGYIARRYNLITDFGKLWDRRGLHFLEPVGRASMVFHGADPGP